MVSQRPSLGSCCCASLLLHVVAICVTSQRQESQPPSTQEDSDSGPPADLDCHPARQPRPFNKSFQLGSLNEVVGHDGVLTISLVRSPARFAYAAVFLKQAKIWPTEFPAVDGWCRKQKELSKGCFFKGAPEAAVCPSRTGLGCTSVTEQAIAESHRRALLHAQKRKHEWTAILEDDTVPVRPRRWDKAFRKAWAKVPGHIKLVRLNWCSFPADYPWGTLTNVVMVDAGEFQLTNWTGYEPGKFYRPGGCTSGYMVHRDVIPRILKLFPCCCAFDCCLQHDLWEQPSKEGGSPFGLDLMISMDAWGSTEYAQDFANLVQNGVLVQDRREIVSSQGSKDWFWKDHVNETKSA